MKNWKTTSTGIVMIVTGIVGLYFAFKNNQLNDATISGTLTSILAGVGLIAAKDSNVTGGTAINQPNDASVVADATKIDKP